MNEREIHSDAIVIDEAGRRIVICNGVRFIATPLGRDFEFGSVKRVDQKADDTLQRYFNDGEKKPLRKDTDTD